MRPLKTARKTAARSAEDAQPAVDPAAAVFPALSALAAISSVAASLFVGGGPRQSRPQRKASLLLRDLESDCLLLQSIFRRLGRSLRGMNGAQGEKGVHAAPLKFGLHGLDIADPDMMAETGRVLGSSSAHALAVMEATASGAIDAPEEAYYGFGDCQERLNRVIAERPSMRTAIDIGLETAVRLTELVTQLKQYAKD